MKRLACVSRFFILYFSFFILLVSCSTEKAKWGNIQYHNTTCHYNVWWNGNESLKEGRQKLYETALDDYTRLLPPEILGTPEDARSINPQMDRAIEKGVKGIKKHSIYVKGVEHVAYIKECYLLTAYATFYKQDYLSTVNTCNILVSQFPGTRAGDEGSVLLARCLVREKRYAEAETALDQLVQNLAQGNFSRSQRDKLFAAMVEATVPQEKYSKAVDYIQQAVEVSRNSLLKARLTFLRAQIYRQLGKRPVAAKYYHEVLRYRVPYVMEFNAKLGEASCADLDHADPRRLERQLDEMLADKKNLEYRDQILFAKGEMFLGMKEMECAADSYRGSVAVATANRAQKAQSALRLGEMLYDHFQDYDQAQRYYDTVMQNLSPDYPRYAAVKHRADMLTELATYTRIYNRNDSLLRVASMPEEERLAYINGIIDSLRRQEQEAREREMLEELLSDARAQQNTLSGDWYFYNPQTVAKGKETFRQRWGMRNLEDLWFISNKNVISFSSFEEEPDEPDRDTLHSPLTNPAGDPNDPHSVAYYLKGLPSTPTQFDSIDSLTSFALLNAGYLFYEGVDNITRALECYHRLADGYTSFSEIVQAFYMLYRIYDRQGNTPQANYYRDMVLMGFPDSDFANLIRDNEYYKELLRRDRRIETDYEELYNHYSEARYSSVLRVARQAEELYEGNPSLQRFRFWKALAMVHLGNREDAVSTLERIVGTTAATDTIHSLAEVQLEMLRNDSLYLHDERIADEGYNKTTRLKVKESKSQKDKEILSLHNDLSPEAQIYRYRDNQQYYVLILVNDRTVRATELQYRLADFNAQYYANAGYKANATLFTDSTQLITIHRFNSESEARGYYRHLQQEESPLKVYASGDYQIFYISTQNYATFYNRKNIDAYMAYFRKYHLEK